MLSSDSIILFLEATNEASGSLNRIGRFPKPNGNRSNFKEGSGLISSLLETETDDLSQQHDTVGEDNPSFRYELYGWWVKSIALVDICYVNFTVSLPEYNEEKAEWN